MTIVKDLNLSRCMGWLEISSNSYNNLLGSHAFLDCTSCSEKYSMNIEDWIKLNKSKFGSPFEQMFVVKVLAIVNDLDLNAVRAQYHFKDLDGKNRYCDFVIQENSIKIAIEIDGFDKKNTGQGMSHDDFVDWQRRQAALTAAGWHVLRFANSDVTKEPRRCQRYIELLLRDQRSKSQHQANLEDAIARMNSELKAAQSQAGTGEQARKLQREINLLKNQLMLAQKSQPLSSSDTKELKQLVARLEQENREMVAANTQLNKQKLVLGGENSTMKTTIWAFTVIIGILIAAGTYVFIRSGSVQLSNSTPANTSNLTNESLHSLKVVTPQSSHLSAKPVSSQQAELRASAQSTTTSAPSCDSPIDWSLARNYVNQRIAIHGVVAEYRHLPKANGNPTWINIGAKYPTKNRLSVVVWGDDRGKFGRAISSNLVNRQICVIGTVQLRNDSPQIAIKWPQELVFQ